MLLLKNPEQPVNKRKNRYFLIVIYKFNGQNLKFSLTFVWKSEVRENSQKINQLTITAINAIMFSCTRSEKGNEREKFSTNSRKNYINYQSSFTAASIAAHFARNVEQSIAFKWEKKKIKLPPSHTQKTHWLTFFASFSSSLRFFSHSLYAQQNSLINMRSLLPTISIFASGC